MQLDWLDFNYFLLIIFGIFFLIRLYFLIRFYSEIFRNNETYDNKVSVSIIIYVNEYSINFIENLKSILIQNYSNFEIVTVIDSNDEAFKSDINQLKALHENLFNTRINSSSSYFVDKYKIARLIGAKAAKNDWLLFTDYTCHSTSNYWLQSLVNSIKKNTEIVIGTNIPKNKLSWLDKCYNYSFLLKYLTFAQKGFPYWASFKNLLIKKDTFLNAYNNHKMDFIDDMILINSFGNKENTTISLSQESFNYSNENINDETWISLKNKYYDIFPFFMKKLKRIINIEYFSTIMFYLSLIACCIFSNMFYFVIYMYLFFIIFNSLIYIKLSKVFKINKNLFLGIILTDIINIINNLIIKYILIENQKIKKRYI